MRSPASRMAWSLAAGSGVSGRRRGGSWRPNCRERSPQRGVIRSYKRRVASSTVRGPDFCTLTRIRASQPFGLFPSNVCSASLPVDLARGDW